MKRKTPKPEPVKRTGSAIFWCRIGIRGTADTKLCQVRARTLDDALKAVKAGVSNIDDWRLESQENDFGQIVHVDALDVLATVLGAPVVETNEQPQPDPGAY